jgi:hypothetical protein
LKQEERGESMSGEGHIASAIRPTAASPPDTKAVASQSTQTAQPVRERGHNRVHLLLSREKAETVDVRTWFTRMHNMLE